MKADDLATLLTPSSGPDLKVHIGQVIAWDSSTGENTISVLGSLVADVPVLSTSDSILLDIGDNVVLLKVQSTYFVLGRVTIPGVTRALGIRTMQNGGVISPTTTSYATYAGSPVLTDVYIGSSRRLLVWIDAVMSVGNNTGNMSVTVSGASTIGATGDARLTSNTADVIQASVSRMLYFDESDTLKSGMHTLTGVFKRGSNSGGIVTVESGIIVALPF